MEPKLKRVTRIDSIPAGSTSFDEQGFLHDTPVVTSAGIFEYALPDGGTRRELRLPEHVFDKESLASYAGKPVVITHEAGSIDKGNVMKEIVGTILSEGFQDGNDVRCKIVIHDIDKVKKIPYRELSLGYSLDLVEEPGVWKGEPYDAIQTNIRINHLAIVEKARAGEQAHLNLDEKKSVGIDDKKSTEGGKEMSNKETHGDSIDMTPEELIEAIKQYKASKATEGAAPTEVKPQEAVKDGASQETEPVKEAAASPMPEKDPADKTGAAPAFNPGEPVVSRKEKTDGDVNALLSGLKELIKAFEGGDKPDSPVPAAQAADCGSFAAKDGCDDNEDSSEDESQSMNCDSADYFREKLEICRIGDKIHMDGLEDKSILDGKKAIISKVLPSIRLDGKNEAYINAAFDLASSQINNNAQRKGVAYQKRQMSSNASDANRMDGSSNESMATAARRRMLERENKEGGNE